MAKCGDNGGLSRLTGLPCQRGCAPGFTRCSLHGAQLPTAKLAAERALALVRAPAIEALHTILHDWGSDACVHCGRPNFENAHPIIRAAQIILDRTGFGPKATLEVSKPDADEFDLELLTDDERLRLSDLLGMMHALKTQVKARLRLADLQGSDDAQRLLETSPECVIDALENSPNP